MLNSIRQRVDDLLNPIVVKELRQAVRGRYVVVLFMLFLLLQLLILGGGMLSMDDLRRTDFVTTPQGQEPFVAMYSILVVASMFFVPLLGALRLNGERSESNVDLYFITSLNSRSIVWGKLLATSIVALVLLSASVPAMMLTYFMRGVELPSVLVLLYLGMWMVVICVQAGLLVAALPVNRLVRSLAGLALAVGICFLIGSMIYEAAVAMDYGFQRFMQTEMFEWASGMDLWLVLLITTWVLFLGLALLYGFTLSLIKPSSSNRTFPARVALLLAWVGTGVPALWYALVDPLVEHWIMVGLWVLILGLPIAGFMLLVAISERDRWGPRLRRSIPRSLLGRLAVMPIFAGAVPGMLVSAGMIVLSMVMLHWGIAGYRAVSKRPEHLSWLIEIVYAVVFYGWAYMLTALLLQRYVVGRLFPKAQTWVVLVLLLGLVMTVQLVGAGVMQLDVEHPSQATGFWLANPFQVHDRMFVEDAIVFAGIWAALVTLLATPWAVGCLRAFRPLEAPAAGSPEVASSDQVPPVPETVETSGG